MGHYQHLTTEERETAMVLREKGESIRSIGLALRRSASTISREFSRNLRCDGTYSANYASKQYHRRRKRCHSERIMANPEVASYVEKRLLWRWTPEQIAGRAKLENYPVSFSYATIYRAIDDRVLPYSLKKVLRFKSKYKKRKMDDKRGKLQGIRPISERPASVENRKQFGHWESDTVIGKRGTGRIATYVERKYGLLIAHKTSGGTPEEFNAVTISSFSALPRNMVKSLTVDRGAEFSHYAELEKSLSTSIYFCDPYSPWQRGSNENTNGLLRQFFPKGFPFDSFSDSDLDAVVSLINHRPRKRLGWRSPAEAIPKQLRSLLHLD